MVLALARRLEQALVRVSQLCAWLAASSLVLIVGIILVSVVMRRVAGAPLYYTEELVGLLLSTSLFLALPMVTVQSSHVRVTFLANFLPPRARIVLSVFAAIVMLAFCVWFLVDAIPWLEFAFKRNIKSEAASLRLWPWMGMLPVSVALCALLVSVRIVTRSDNAPGDQVDSAV